MFNNFFHNLFNDKAEPSTLPLDGKIHYLFCNGLVAYQEELNLGQDFKLSEIVTDLFVTDISQASVDPTKFVQDMLAKLNHKNKIIDLLRIILIPHSSGAITDDQLLTLKNSELETVIMDFFSLNPRSIKWLKIIGKEVISIAMTSYIKTSKNG